jgi:large subunit ribosomal protein L25
MDTVKLQVKERELTGNGPARRLRAEGRLPGVLYSKGTEPTAISLDPEELVSAIHKHGHNVVLELEIGDAAKAAKSKKKAAAHFAVVKDLQRHPIKRSLLHVDLLEVDLAVEIESPVAIELVGTPAGAEEGGIMDWEHREVIVRALPSAMPDVVELDISGLLIGHHLSVDALKTPEGAQILDDPSTVVVTLAPPRVVEVAAAAEVAEPEVVGGAKTEE